MNVRMPVLAAAGVLVAGLATAASAQRIEIDGPTMRDRSEMRIERRERRVVREPRVTGSVREERGASYYAPGQVKKRMGEQSAREFAPGQRKKGN